MKDKKSIWMQRYKRLCEILEAGSAGFVDQYSRLKKLSEYASEEDVHFIKVNLKRQDSWVGKMIMELGLPHGVIVAMIRRGSENIVPRGNVVLKHGDTLILGAEGLKDDLMLLEGDHIILYSQERISGSSTIQS